MQRPDISQQRMEELKLMAKGLYGTIIGLTEDPFEGVTLISMIHLTLWMNFRQAGAKTETMLEGYCKDFIVNCEANDAFHRKELN